jgi:hypothetical protein
MEAFIRLLDSINGLMALGLIFWLFVKVNRIEDKLEK